MPITPRFTISQSSSHVLLTVRVPHVRVSSESIQVALSSPDEQTAGALKPSDAQEGGFTTLHFSSQPYLLVLNFDPNQFHETAAEACASYEPSIENGVVQLSLLKQHQGKAWENLDLVGRMVQPKLPKTQLPSANPTSSWLKEVTATTTSTSTDAQNDDKERDDGMEQPAGSYGFARMFSGIYADLHRDGLAREMLELPWEESNAQQILEGGNDNPFAQRRQQRWNLENYRFDKDRWLQDLDIEDDYVYQCAMFMRPHWQEATTEQQLSTKMAGLALQDGPGNEQSLQREEQRYFTEDEQLKLHSIPYPLLPSVMAGEAVVDNLLLGLWDILFAFVYDHLTTDGEATVESAWTISTLSTLLSSLEDYTDLCELSPDGGVSRAVIASFRRSLVYPYIRNLEFATHCGQQVLAILQRGPRCVIRCLLQTRQILQESDLYYLGNKLFVDPYLAWLQRDIAAIENERWLSVFCQRLERCLGSEQRVTMSDLGLETVIPTTVTSSSSDDDDDDKTDGGSSKTSSSEDPVENPAETKAASSALLDHNLGSQSTGAAVAAEDRSSKMPSIEEV